MGQNCESEEIVFSNNDEEVPDNQQPSTPGINKYKTKPTVVQGITLDRKILKSLIMSQKLN